MWNKNASAFTIVMCATKLQRGVEAAANFHLALLARIFLHFRSGKRERERESQKPQVSPELFEGSCPCSSSFCARTRARWASSCTTTATPRFWDCSQRRVFLVRENQTIGDSRISKEPACSSLHFAPRTPVAMMSPASARSLRPLNFTRSASSTKYRETLWPFRERTL